MERIRQSSDPGSLRVGVVGVGYWGSKHLRVCPTLDGVGRVVAVDSRFDQLPAGRALMGHDPRFASLDEALPFVDAVVLATPPTTHCELALQAIAAGKHVLVEKPMATSTADAMRMITAAARAGVVLMVGHTFEYNAAVWMLRDLIQTQELGELFYLDSARLNLGLYQRDVNVIVDLAPHDVSIANHILNSVPTSVEAWGSRHVDPNLEDVAYLRLHYEEIGVRASIHVSWLDPHKVRRTTAVGSKKMAVYNDMAAEERIRVLDRAALPSADNPTAGVSYHHGDILSPALSFNEPLAVQDSHFVECILESKMPRTDGVNGLAVVQVLEAAEIALREGRRVDIEDLDVYGPVRERIAVGG